MKRLIVFGACALFVLATPAGAAKAPTAMQLVQRLVRAGVCDAAVAQTASGTIAQCTAHQYTITNDIEIHAAKNRSAMLKDLDRGVAAWCTKYDEIITGGSSGVKPAFRLGSTWWTEGYRELESAAIEDVLGGKVKTYACP